MNFNQSNVLQAEALEKGKPMQSSVLWVLSFTVEPLFLLLSLLFNIKDVKKKVVLLVQVVENGHFCHTSLSINT